MAFELPAPSTLESIFQMNPGAFGQAQDWMQGAQQQNQAALEKSRLANMFDQQNNPLLLEQKRLANQTAQAQLPGLQADSNMRMLESQEKQASTADRMKALKAEYAAKFDSNDLSVLEDQAQRMAYSTDPKVRAQGSEILRMHKDIVRDREKQDAQKKRELAKIAAQGAEQRLTQGQAIEAGKYTMNQRKDSGDFTSRLQGIKGARNIHAALVSEAARLEMDDPSSPEVQRLKFMAEAIRPQAEAEIKSSTPGSINAGELGGLPTNAGPQIQPRNVQIPAPVGATTTNSAIFRRAFGGYEPSKYDYQISPDGQPQRRLKGTE